MKIWLTILLSLILAQCTITNYLIPLTLFLFSIYIFLLIKCPEIGLVIVIIAFNNFFSLLDPDMLRVPGFFRIKDLFFISAFIPLSLGFYKGTIKFQNTQFRKAIWVILFFTFLQILNTYFIEHQNLNFTIRQARLYFYYLLYFPLVFLINNEQKFKRFFNLICISGIIYSTLIIIQYFAGTSFIIFKYASAVGTQNLGGIDVTRSYTSGSSFAIITCFYYLYKTYYKIDNRYINLIICLVTFIGGVYLGFSRANLFGIISGLFVTIFVFFKFTHKMKIFIYLIISFASMFSIFKGLSYYTDNKFINPITHSIILVTSAADDFINRRGTFEYRLKDSASRIDLFLKNPIMGVGFIHPDSNLIDVKTRKKGKRGVRTNDSGLITLLLDFGLIGLLWLSILTIVFIRICLKNFQYQTFENPINNILVLAMFSYYLSRLFSFLTLTEFVNQTGIAALCVSFLILEHVKRQNDGLIHNHR